MQAVIVINGTPEQIAAVLQQFMEVGDKLEITVAPQPRRRQAKTSARRARTAFRRARWPRLVARLPRGHWSYN